MVPKKKRKPRGKAATNPYLAAWLQQLAAGVKQIWKSSKPPMKHAAFAKKVGISKETFSVVVNGRRNYGIDVLLPILAVSSEDPVDTLFAMHFPKATPEQVELHRKLQVCLGAGEKYSRGPRDAIEFAYGFLGAEQSKPDAK